MDETRPPEIGGERVSLRPTSERDLDLLAAWLADPGISRWWNAGRGLSRKEVAERYTGQDPLVESFIIEADAKPVGYLQFWKQERSDGQLALFISPEVRGRGFGPEAAQAALQYLAREGPWNEAVVDPFVDDPKCFSGLMQSRIFVRL